MDKNGHELLVLHYARTSQVPTAVRLDLEAARRRALEVEEHARQAEAHSNQVSILQWQRSIQLLYNIVPLLAKTTWN